MNSEHIEEFEDFTDDELAVCLMQVLYQIDKRGIEIFKLQVPIMGAPHALIYNKSRDKEGTIEVDGEIYKFMGGEMKKFLWGKQNEDGQIMLFCESEWQDW